jgi:hypothetical protein
MRPRSFLRRYPLGRSQAIGLLILAVLVLWPIVGRANADEDVRQLLNIVNGPMQNLYVAGWGLMGLGLVIGTGWEQLKIFQGQAPQPAQVVGRALVAAATLAIYVPFCKTVWNITSEIAGTILDPKDLDLLSLGLRTLVSQALTAVTKDGILFSPFSMLRNIILGVFMDFMLWGIAFIIDGIRVIQVAIFNVVFLFGPIALGLHVMGFKTGQLWLTALLEVCTWNITIAIISYGASRRVTEQFVRNAQMGAFEFDWWRDMKEITFLAALILFVPVITSRFFGFAALGELSKAALGSSTSVAIGTTLLSMGGVQSAPHMQDQSTLGDGSDKNDRRAGD